MKILLIYPEMPSTCWSMDKEIKLGGFKSIFPPLGLLTIAAMLPEEWEKKLIDVNVEKLKDSHIIESDYVFIGGMNVQEVSMRKILARVKKFNKPIIGGGPLLTHEYDRFPEFDHLILNEAELTLPTFLEDLKNGNPKHIYQSEEYANVQETPIPLWSIAKMEKYGSTLIQYSRGCPYMCDFCDVTSLFGRKPRTKSADQIIAELDSIPNLDSFGLVFFADDNLIGNRKDLKENLLPRLIEWQEQRKEKVWFMTQLTINLADDEELMDLMSRAGFGTVFIGLETPDEQTLIECRKKQNTKRNLIDNIKYLQAKGFEVYAGFILGFDNDDDGVFERQLEFIQQSGIVLAIVGLLNAPPGTELFDRMKREGRLLDQNWFFEGATNIVTKMDRNQLLEGFTKNVSYMYGGKGFYERSVQFLKQYQMPDIHKNNKVVLRYYMIRAFFAGIYHLGINNPDRKYFWKLLFWCIKNKPEMWDWSIKLFARARHFRDVYKDNLKRSEDMLKELKVREQANFVDDIELKKIVAEVN